MSGLRQPLIMSGILSVNALTEVSKTTGTPDDKELVILPLGKPWEYNEGEMEGMKTWADTTRYGRRREPHMYPFKKTKNRKPWDTHR